jgi:hypothetical protein
MKLEARMTKLELIVEHHLEQSGFIQTDLVWLKKAFWALTSGVITLNVTIVIAFVNYLLRK